MSAVLTLTQKAMSRKLEQTVTQPSIAATEMLNPADVLETMIELRFQSREIEAQFKRYSLLSLRLAWCSIWRKSD